MAKRKCDPEREEFWRLAIQLQQQSGLSVREFCKREQLQEPSFYMWRSKLRSRDAVNRENAHAGSLASGGHSDRAMGKKKASGASSYPNPPAQASIDSQSSLFVPVRVSRDATVDQRERIEIVVAGSRIVRVPDQFDRQTLREVLCVLEGEAC